MMAQGARGLLGIAALAMLIATMPAGAEIRLVFTRSHVDVLESLVGRIKDSEVKRRSIAKVGRLRAAYGDKARALADAESTKSDLDRDSVLVQLAHAAMEAGRDSEMGDLVSRMSSKRVRAAILIDYARSLGRRGKTAKAGTALKAARELLVSTGSLAWDTVADFIVVANAQVTLGARDGAIETLAAARAIVDRYTAKDLVVSIAFGQLRDIRLWRAAELVRIHDVERSLGLQDAARATLERVGALYHEASAELGGSPQWLASNDSDYILVATALAKAGALKEPAREFSRMVALAEQEPDRQKGVEALSRIVVAQATGGLVADARKTADRMEALFDAMPPVESEVVVSALADAVFAIGRLDSALVRAKAIDAKLAGADVVERIFKHAVETGRLDAAEHVLKAAGKELEEYLAEPGSAVLAARFGALHVSKGRKAHGEKRLRVAFSAAIRPTEGAIPRLCYATQVAAIAMRAGLAFGTAPVWDGLLKAAVEDIGSLPEPLQQDLSVEGIIDCVHGHLPTATAALDPN